MYSEKKYSQLHQMEILLRWEGRLNNARLRGIFGLNSSVRASVLIREFREAHPTWLIHDSKTKNFYPTADFLRPLHTAQSNRRNNAAELAHYLVLAGMPYATPIGEEHSLVWVGYPDIAAPGPAIYSSMHSAARERRVVSISYRSMKNPAPHQRTVSPHSLIRAGCRWHVRAYCEEAAGYRDFALGRIVSAKILKDRQAEFTSESDTAWMTPVKISLVAHPALSAEQAEVIRFEYMNGAVALVETCRAALIQYFVQDVRAATNVETQRPPDYQLAVQNVREIEQWLF
ncbi:helix-turn-helix transcriptional regulator [Janthinobacterium sp. J1-1]|uniref:helix-turn-helix transcriptional regulator n=1 Tax=unclassified Janthinobacterium TaxID=2610881 RepID=UPI002810E6AC|nr:WYL domain-containing protein [Janthinobacterium sp. J1-1]